MGDERKSKGNIIIAIAFSLFLILLLIEQGGLIELI